MSTKKPVQDWLRDFDHLDHAWIDDAHSVWDTLREKCPVAHTERYGGVYLPTRYKDISDAAYASELFTSRTIIVRSIPLLKPFPAYPMNATGESHRVSRRRLMTAFSKPKVEAFRSAVERQARELLFNIGEAKRIDIVRAYTRALSARAVMRFVGVPEGDADLLNRWTADVLIFGIGDAVAVSHAADEMAAYCRKLALKRFHKPENDVTSALIKEWNGADQAYINEIATTLRLLLLAGLDTTASILTGALWHLANQPSDRHTLASDPSRMPAALEEYLRVFAPTTMAREIDKDTEFAGTYLKAGELIMLPFPAANRDPAIFPDPHTIKLDRAPNKHLAFGIGIHRCLGDHLARMIIDVGIRAWLAHFPNYALEDDPRIEWSIGTVRGMTKLYVQTGLMHSTVLRPLRTPSKLVRRAYDTKVAGGNAQRLYSQSRKLQIAGRIDEALLQLRSVLQANPKHIDALLDVGVINHDRGKGPVAQAYFQRASALAPSDHRPLHNLSVIAFRTSRFREAEDLAKKALDLAPHSVELRHLYASILSAQGKTEDSRICLQHASVLQSHNIHILQENMILKRSVCDWTNFCDDDSKIRDFVNKGHVVPPFSLLTTQATNAEQLVCAQRWAKTFERPKTEYFSNRRPGSHSPFRIGYLSGDFHDHATSRLVAEFLESHNRERFSIYGYSYGPDNVSPMRTRMIQAFDVFRELKDASSRKAAHCIYDDKIDILVDMKGYTLSARSDILSWRPAPIQVNYLGFPGTMGTDLIDYVITDRIVSPPEYEIHASERFAYLPHCFQPNDTLRPQPKGVLSRAKFGVDDNQFIFCCFNAGYKFNPVVFDAWMRILKSVPHGVLFLLVRSQEQANNLAAEAQRRVVDPRRLIFVALTTMEEHLERCALADLFLDTLPVSAFTTASDALWAGLPVLTCAGSTPAGRGSASLLHAMGIPELVTENLADYEAAAIRLAQQPEQLREISLRIKEGRKGRAPFDTKSLVRDLEYVYELMIDTYNKKPLDCQV